MAKVNLTFDTQSKELSVTINGASLPNVEAAYFDSRYEDGFRMSIHQLEYDKGEDMAKRMVTMASEGSMSEVARSIAYQSTVEDLVVVDGEHLELAEDIRRIYQ